MASDADKIKELVTKLGALEAENRTLRNSAVCAAEAAESTCTKLLLYQGVVDAARKFVEDPTYVNALFALDNAVADLDTALKKVPQA